MTAIRRTGDARALFVALAYEQGWGIPTKLADVCGCSPKTIRRHASAIDREALHAARLCLADERLRYWYAPAANAASARR